MRWSATTRLLTWELVLWGVSSVVLCRAGEVQSTVSVSGDVAPCASLSAESTAPGQAMGRAMMLDYLRNELPWQGREVNEYVNRLGQNLARASGSDLVFEFRVVRSPQVNARSFPGGFIVINSGVIVAAEDEAELASVLAHEIAHVNSCHGKENTWRATALQLLTVLPLVMAAGPAGMAISYTGSMATPYIHARGSRSRERDADRLAVLYLARAGYDPLAAGRFFRRLAEAQESQKIRDGGIFASHPRAETRGMDSRHEAETLPGTSPQLVNTSEFEEIQGVVVTGETAPVIILTSNN